MSEVRLIDADALKESWVRSDHKGTLINFIDNAPLVPAVPLEDHERMKRELHSEITSLKKQLAEVTVERNQAVEDLRKAAQCDNCKHNGDTFCYAEACNDGDQWQWRGVPEKQTLSAAAKTTYLGEHVCYGKIDYENNLILLSSTRGRGHQHKCITLLHEILHGIREHAGIEIANEEAVVDMFAKGIYQVLQDNGKRLFDIAEKSDEPSIDGSAISCETLNHISTEVKKSCP